MQPVVADIIMSLRVVVNDMADSDLVQKVKNLPVDQAHMLRVIAKSENFETDSKELYYRTRGSVDTEEYLRVKIWYWQKQRGKEVSEKPPRDPRRDMKVISKLKKSDMISFAKFYNINHSITKAELLEKLQPKLAENPIFHQMLISLIVEGLVSTEYKDGDDEGRICLRIDFAADKIAKELRNRSEDDHKTLRDFLNRFLIEAFEIQNTTLERALLKTDRRNSVEKENHLLAACDIPISVPGDVTTSAYGVILWILTATELKPNDRVLICGATGGMTAVLAKHIVGDNGEVSVIEWNEETAQWARDSIARHGFKPDSIKVTLQDDVTVGSGDEGYWNTIIMNGSIPKIPYSLLDQLDDEEGRILFFMQNHRQSQTCWVVHKNESIVTQKELSRFRFTPIYGKYGWDSIEKLQLDYERIKKTQKEKSLLERIARMDELLPYPLSRAFSVASNAKTPNDQHKQVIRLFDLFNKYLVFQSLALIGHNGKMNDSMRDLLNKFSKKAQMGDWVQFLRQVANGKYNSPQFSNLKGFLKSKLTSETVLSTYLLLQKETGKETAGRRKSVSTIDFLGLVVSYRNISQDGHGRRRNSTIIEHNAQLIRESFIDIMSKPNPITNWELFHVDSNERRIEGGVKYAKRGCMGSNFSYDSSIEKSDSEIVQDTIAGGVYINAEGKYFTISPWLAFGEGQHGDEELFVYKSNAKWETYHNSDRYPADKEKDLMTRLIEKYPPSKKPLKNKKEGKAVFAEMLALFVEDGLLESWELRRLVEILKKFGLCEDDVDGLSQIRKIVDEEYPDVVFEPLNDD